MIDSTPLKMINLVVMGQFDWFNMGQISYYQGNHRIEFICGLAVHTCHHQYYHGDRGEKMIH